MSQPLQPFGERLKQVLAEQRRSQRALARDSGISQTVINRIVRGDVKPTIDQLSTGFGIDPWKLAHGTTLGGKATTELLLKGASVPSSVVDVLINDLAQVRTQLEALKDDLDLAERQLAARRGDADRLRTAELRVEYLTIENEGRKAHLSICRELLCIERQARRRTVTKMRAIERAGEHAGVLALVEVLTASLNEDGGTPGINMTNAELIAAMSSK